jgi:hypothetical protein
VIDGWQASPQSLDVLQRTCVFATGECEKWRFAVVDLPASLCSRALWPPYLSEISHQQRALLVVVVVLLLWCCGRTLYAAAREIGTAEVAGSRR